MMQQTNRVKNPKKQRKRHFNAPAHIRHKLMSAPLSSELAASRGIKSLPVRKGDTVRIQRGDHKGFEGKVSRVDMKEYRIYLEGLTREKVDGTNIFLPIHPSKVQIRTLMLDDNWRKNILSRKKELQKQQKVEKPVTKPAKKPAKAPEKPKAAVEEAVPTEEKAVSEIAKEQAPETKKAPAKKPAAKEAAPEVKEPAPKVAEEKAPAKKTVTPKAAKKPAAPKEELEKAAAKPRAKSKTPKTEGGQ
jgi:large subunit ribosomal protein L24